MDKGASALQQREDEIRKLDLINAELKRKLELEEASNQKSKKTKKLLKSLLVNGTSTNKSPFNSAKKWRTPTTRNVNETQRRLPNLESLMKRLKRWRFCWLCKRKRFLKGFDFG